MDSPFFSQYKHECILLQQSFVLKSFSRVPLKMQLERIFSSPHPVRNLTINNFTVAQRYTYRVLQTIQIKLMLSCVWAEWAILGSAKTALKVKYEI